MRHTTRYLAPLLISGFCLLLFIACTPVQVPRIGSMDDLPNHPDAQVIEVIPNEVAGFITQTEQWVGSACPGIWRSLLVTGTVESVDGWYRRALSTEGWRDAANEVDPHPVEEATPASSSKQDTEQEPAPLTWSVWYRDKGEERSIVTLFYNPAGLSVALANTPEPAETAPTTPVSYTYALIFYCPIRE